MLNNEQVVTVIGMVEAALEDGVTMQLGKSFAESNDSETVKNAVVEAYGEAINAAECEVEEYGLSVEQYLKTLLESDYIDKVRNQESFESEEEEENEGFYWFDELDSWVWLP